MSSKSQLLDPFTVVFHDVTYGLPWHDMPVGGSFFLPTTLTAPQARKLLRPRARAAGIAIEVRERHEFGRYGVRVWRVD